MSVVDGSLAELIREMPELEGIQGAQDQRELAGILKKAGECEKVFLQQVPEISAQEQITREDLGWVNRAGEPGTRRSEGKTHARRTNLASYSYLIIPHLTIEGISIDEFRVPESNNSGDSRSESGLTMTKGFALMPLHFHPAFQHESAFRYLGRQKVDERNTYVVAFAQRSDGARFTAQITQLGNSVDIPLQGVAWIEAQNFHIVRMRTELLTTYPQVKLDELTTQLEFAEVRLQQVPEPLWLPTRVAVTTVSSGKRYRNLHTYGSFKRFGSESRIVSERIGNTAINPR